MSTAAARRPGSDFEVDIGDSKVVGVADDVGEPAIFLDSPWWWEAALGHGSDYTHVNLVADRQNPPALYRLGDV